MRTNYRINSGIRFNVLSKDQLQTLFDGVLHLLEYTGLDVHHEEARDILQKSGATIEGLRVRIPAYLVKRALQMAPRSFTIFARDGNPDHDIHIGPGRAYFGPGPTPPNFIDVETLERRPFLKSDARIVAKVVDALPNIDFCGQTTGTSDIYPVFFGRWDCTGDSGRHHHPGYSRIVDGTGSFPDHPTRHPFFYGRGFIGNGYE